MAAVKEIQVEVECLNGVHCIPAFVPGSGGTIGRVFSFRDTQPGVDTFDRVVAVAGVPVSDDKTLQQELAKFSRGQPFKFTVARQPIGAPSNKDMDNLTFEVAPTGTEVGFGMTVVSNRAGTHLYVIAIQEAAARTEMQLGDHVIAVNGKPVKTVQEWKAAIKGQTKLSVVCKRSKEATDKPVVAVAGSGNASSQTPKETIVRLSYEEDEQVGVFVDEKLKVVRIMAGSLAEDAFVVGDQVIAINNFPVKDQKDFYQRMRHPGSNGQLDVKVMRVGYEPDAEKRHTPAVVATEQTKKEIEESSRGDHMAVMLKFALPSNAALGVAINEHMKAIKVQEDSVGGKHFHLGDIIKSVNGTVVNNENEFYAAVEKNRESLVICIDRSKMREQQVEMRQLPPNIEKLIQRHAGFDYHMITVKFDEKSNRPFGLSLANCSHNRVIVTTCKEGSVAADHFKTYDRMCVINGMPVTDENVAKEYICCTGGSFHCVIERPRAAEQWTEVKNQYEAWRRQRQVAQKAEDVLAADAMLIAQQELARRKAGNIPAAKKVLKKTPQNPSAKQPGIKFNENATLVYIASDVPPGKKLRSLR